MTMSCERCDELLLDYLDGDLPHDGPEGTQAMKSHMASCASCSAEHDRITRGLQFAAALPIADAPPDTAAAILLAAREHVGAVPPARTPTTSLPPADESSLWSRLRGFMVRPQFAMATVMMVAVAFGLWYVPRHQAEEVALGLRPEPGMSVPHDPEADSEAAVDTEVEVVAIGGGEAAAPRRDTGRARIGPNVDVAGADDERELADPEPIAADDEDEPSAEAEVAEVAEVAEEQLARGLQAFGRSDYPAAIDELSAVVRAPSAPATLLPTATHHLARSYVENGDCESAVTRYEQLFRRFPTYGQSAAALMEAGRCYVRLGDEARARQIFEMAAEHPGTRDAAQAALDELPEPSRRALRPSRRTRATSSSSRSASGSRSSGTVVQDRYQFPDSPY